MADMGKASRLEAILIAYRLKSGFDDQSHRSVRCKQLGEEV
jgi:hypothetical protein